MIVTNKSKLNDLVWLDSCEFLANRRSKDPNTKVGAMIVRPDNTLASQGFNGFAKKYPDVRYDDPEFKHKRVIHAEMNAILFAKEPVDGYTLYCNVAPCGRCMSVIAQAGIKRVVAYDDLFFRPNLDHDVTVDICSKLGIELLIWHNRNKYCPDNDHFAVFHVWHSLHWPYKVEITDYRQNHFNSGRLKHEWLDACVKSGCC